MRGAHFHVSLMRDGKLHQKYFVDAKCRGPTEALRLARAWRDSVAVQKSGSGARRFLRHRAVE